MKFTIMTPTYNRAYILENLYKSLEMQTFKDFEWMIVDDGSTDNTKALVKEMTQRTDHLPIKYYRLEQNRGKCNAINYGLEKAAGEIFLVVDSDDRLVPDALTIFNKSLNNDDESNYICAISAQMKAVNYGTDNQYCLIDKPGLNEKSFVGTFFDRYKSFKGEQMIAFYTSIHKKYKYPIIDNEKFMTEAVVWNRMANDGYKVRYINEIVCEYEYQQDGLSLQGKNIFYKNPRGYWLWQKELCTFTYNNIFDKLRLYYSFYIELHKYLSDDQLKEIMNINGSFLVLIRATRHVKQIINRRLLNEEDCTIW